MPFDDTQAALVALLSQPIAVASVVLLTGVHAAIWLLVFERVGFPPVLAWLLLVPPLTFLLPLYVALARWPSQRSERFPTRPQRARSRSAQRAAQEYHFTRPVLGAFNSHRPLRLDSNGQPRFRIPLPPPSPSDQRARDYMREVMSRNLLP